MSEKLFPAGGMIFAPFQTANNVKSEEETESQRERFLWNAQNIPVVSQLHKIAMSCMINKINMACATFFFSAQ